MPIYATPKRSRNRKPHREEYTPVDIAALNDGGESYSKYNFYLLVLILVVLLSSGGWWWFYGKK